MKLLYILLVPISIFCKPSLFLVNDTSDHYHWGCTGTSLAIKEQISEIGYDISSASILEVARLKCIPESLENTAFLKIFIDKNPKYFEKIRNCDVVVINGEGSLHQNRAVPRALLTTAYIAKKFFHKHVEIIDHSCFPEDCMAITNEKIKSFYKTAYETVDFISFREPLSFDVMKTLGIEGNIAFATLPLYIKNHYSEKRPSKGEKTIVLAGSVSWHPKGIKTIVTELQKWEQKGYKIKVLIGAKDNPAYDDKVLVQYLKEELHLSWDIVNASSINTWLDTIDSADLLISGRFQHSIAAMCLKTQFVILNSNTPKIKGMLTFLPIQKEILHYLDPLLEQKLSAEMQLAFQMEEKHFPIFDNLCTDSLRNFEGLKAYLKQDLPK